MPAPNASAIVPFDGSNVNEANSFATLEQLGDVINLRLDHAYWDGSDEASQVRATIQAYDDLRRLPWRRGAGWDLAYARSQTRLLDDLGESVTDEVLSSLVTDQDRRPELVRAQAVQAIFLLGGTQIREMQRLGVTSSRQMQGAELGFSPYKGPVGAVTTEVLEIIGRYLDLMPKRPTFARHCYG